MREIATGFKFPVLLLNISGLHYNTPTKYSRLMSAFYMSLYTCVILLVFIQFFNIHNNVDDFSTNAEALFGYIHHLGVLCCLIYRKAELKSLIEVTRTFKNILEYTDDTNTELVLMQRRNLLIQRSYFFVVFISLILIGTTPIYGRPLPVGVWTMENRPLLYRTLLVLELLTLVPLGFLLSFISSMFLGACVELIVQFRILGYDVQKLITQTHCSEYSLKLCIAQHDALLRLLKRVSDFYSPIFSFMCISTTPFVCMELYLMCEGNSTITFIQQFVYFFTMLMQISFYCVPADYLASEAENFVNSVYNSMWYTNYKKNTWKLLPLVMQRSQQRILFTAGGLVGIDARTPLRVLKVAWSICAVLRASKV